MVLRRATLCSLTLLAVVAVAEEPPSNRLGRESSPYLLQHATNPVHWQPWGPAAFARAKAEGKLVFLSSGYHACHWCHVMERESFQNPVVAELLNAHFVCIKVDREERPDVDHVYLSALNAMGQPGGWPLSMFLTADGKPIAGGTYWPPEDREINGETAPGFLTVLQAVIDFHEKAPDDIRRTAELRAEQTRRALAIKIHLADTPPPRQLVDAARDAIMERFDAEHGGLGQPPAFIGPKFPRPPQWMLLLEEQRRTPSEQLRQAIHKTLTEMAQGGIYDQLGGGFHRYSTERTWTVPHFEKMLSDNAQLLELYAAAYRQAPEPLYRQVIQETAEFAVRELMTADGVFGSSLDADTEHEEGRYYVWTAEELAAALPDAEDLAFARHHLRATDGVNFEDRSYVLTRRTTLSANDFPRLDRLRQTLLAARERRPRPSVDSKVLTSWNGLMIAGLATAGAAINEPAFVQRAERAAEFLLETVRTNDGRLFHVYAAAPGESDRAQIPGYLDDYACLVHGLLALHDVTGEDRWLVAARGLTDTMIARFQDEPTGGFYFTDADHDALFVRLKDQHDGVQLCGNSQAALNLVRLWRATGVRHYRDLADRTFAAFAGALESQPSGLSGMARAMVLVEDPI